MYGAVGSFNLDRWSYDRNLEVAVALLDEGVAGRLEAVFLEDLDMSREVHLAGWKERTLLERLVHWIAYQLMKV